MPILKHLYHTYLGYINPDRVWGYIKENKIKIGTCGFGQMIGLASNSDLLEKIYALIHEDGQFNKSILLQELNQLNTYRIANLLSQAAESIASRGCGRVLSVS